MDKMKHTDVCLILWIEEAGEQMKIAIVGSSGYIGGKLASSFSSEGHEVLRFGRSGDVDGYLDLENVESFDYGQLKDIDFVLFTAAISGPDKCATETELCWRVNVVGTGCFIEEALRKGCRVLFFSSDAVYASRPGETYDEDSAMEPLTPYGRMKQEIEERFRGRHGFKTIRLSYVVSNEDKFVSYLRGCKEKKISAEIFHPFYRNVIMLDEVMTAIVWLLENWMEYKPSVLCLAGEELVSRLRMADEFNDIYDFRMKYSVVMPGENFFKNRPRITRMRSRYLFDQGVLIRQNFTERFRKQIKGK